MMSDDDRKSRIDACRAAVKTDSLAVVLDGTKLSPAVSESFLKFLKYDDRNYDGTLPAQTAEQWINKAFNCYSELGGYDSGEGVEFAMLLSVFIHECRHVHDFRSTRIGAESLLRDLNTYCSSMLLVKRLREWQHAHPNEKLEIPITSEHLSRFSGEFVDIAQLVELAWDRKRSLVHMLNAPSRGPSVPGFSIIDLLEWVGFQVQIDWLAGFDQRLAKLLGSAVSDSSNAMQKYVRPSLFVQSLSQLMKRSIQMNKIDPSLFVWSALNSVGLDNSFNEHLHPSEKHPGTWLQHCFRHYINLAGDPRITDPTHAMSAIQCRWDETGVGTPNPLLNDAIMSIRALAAEIVAPKVETLKDFKDRDALITPVMLFGDVAPTYIEMQHICVGEQGDTFVPALYHSPGYFVALQFAGKLPGVYCRMYSSKDDWIDFFTPSETLRSHIGIHRVACTSHTQQSLLLSNESVFDIHVSSSSKGLREPNGNLPGLLLCPRPGSTALSSHLQPGESPIVSVFPTGLFPH